jgi:hypothetical protein
MTDLMAELKEIGACYKTGDLAAGLAGLAALWSKIPEPKTATANAYLVIEYGVAFALKTDDLVAAKNWASFALPFIERRQDRGEVEFLIGKVQFADGDIEAAKQSFAAANKKSNGRIFQQEDPRYQALLSK